MNECNKIDRCDIDDCVKYFDVHSTWDMEGGYDVNAIDGYHPIEEFIAICDKYKNNEDEFEVTPSLVFIEPQTSFNIQQRFDVNNTFDDCEVMQQTQTDVPQLSLCDDTSNLHSINHYPIPSFPLSTIIETPQLESCTQIHTSPSVATDYTHEEYGTPIKSLNYERPPLQQVTKCLPRHDVSVQTDGFISPLCGPFFLGSAGDDNITERDADLMKNGLHLLRLELLDFLVKSETQNVGLGISTEELLTAQHQRSRCILPFKDKPYVTSIVENAAIQSSSVYTVDTDSPTKNELVSSSGLSVSQKNELHLSKYMKQWERSASTSTSLSEGVHHRRYRSESPHLRVFGDGDKVLNRHTERMKLLRQIQRKGLKHLNSKKQGLLRNFPPVVMAEVHRTINNKTASNQYYHSHHHVDEEKNDNTFKINTNYIYNNVDVHHHSKLNEFQHQFYTAGKSQPPVIIDESESSIDA